MAKKKMTLAQVKARLRKDPVGRARFLVATANFYEEIGMPLAPAQLKKLAENSLKTAAAARGGATARTVAIITIF